MCAFSLCSCDGCELIHKTVEISMQLNWIWNMDFYVQWMCDGSNLLEKKKKQTKN